MSPPLPVASLAAAAPTPGSSVSAADIVLPAVVQVVQDAHGSIRDSRDGSTHGPYDVTFEGSGFFVSGDGYIVTAAHIADPTAAELNDELSGPYIDELYNCDPSTASDQCAGVENAHHDEVVARTTAVDAGSVLHVLLQSMSPADTGMPATLARSSRSPFLDVAVIKVDGHNEPVAVLAHASPPRGAAVQVIGYPSTGNADQTDQVPTVTSGSVLALPGPDPTSDIAAAAHLVEVDATIKDGDSGGPGVAADGTVIGIVSYGNSDNDNFLVSPSDVAGIVAAVPVMNSLGPVDTAWREALHADTAHDAATAVADYKRCAELNSTVVQCRDRATRSVPAGGPGAAGGVPFALVVALLLTVALLAGGAGFVLARARRRTAGG